MTVLVIDDEAAMRLLCRVNLEAEGMDVLEAVEGDGGIELAKSERPDVIVLDVMLPGLDGWQVAEELQRDERTRAIPIVFLTGSAELSERLRELGSGAAVVTKPFDPGDLVDLVRQLAGR